MTVLGLDGCKGGWVAVAVDASGYIDAFAAPTVADAERIGLERWNIDAMVIDIPIAIPDTGPRLADVEARRFIRPRHNSVFPTPVRAALEAPDYPAARIASVAARGKSCPSRPGPLATRSARLTRGCGSRRWRPARATPR